MLNIKGFGIINALADNDPNIISTLGELSTDSITFSRESDKAVLVDAALGEVNFQSFTCRNVDNDQVVIPLAYQTSILTITNWLYNKAKIGQVPATPLEVVQMLTDEFGTVIDNIIAGNVISKGIVRLPTSISWSIRAQPNGNLIQVWFSDPAFQLEYDGKTILIIPPLPNLDSLFESSPVVKQMLDARGVDAVFEEVEAARGNSPYTILRTFPHNRVSQVQPSPIVTNWTVIMYGRAGDDIDTINNAIIDFVLENSSYTLEQWKQLIPSLFVNTEFVGVPYWDKIAIENQTVSSGLYSPIVTPADILDYAMLAANGLSESYVASKVNHLQTTHKSIAVSIFGGQENVDAIYTVAEKYPDYIAVHTSSADFARMAPATQAWSVVLHNLVKEAEVMTPFSVLPEGIGRVVRSNKVYATKRVGNAQWLIYVKFNMGN